MLEIFAISGLINAITAVTFGCLVIAKNWRDIGNRLFFLMTTALALWGFSYWEWLSASDPASALFWLELLSFGSLFIPVFFFHWISIVLQRSDKNRVVLIGSYAIACGMTLFLGSTLFIQGISQKLFFPYWPTAGTLYTIYIFSIYSLLILYSLYLLVRALLWPGDEDMRGRVIYILIGAILGFGGGFSDFFLWYNIMIPPYGTFLVAAFPFLLGYAALKHNLFSLKTIAAEILVFFISVVLLIEAVLSTTAVETILRFAFFAVASAAGYLLIRSVYREVEQREEIEKLSQEKSEFMTFASHEIRNPITAMRGYASLIADGTTGEVSAKAKDVAQKILVNGDTVLSLISEFLNKSKVELGQIAYTIADVNVGKTIQSIAEGFVAHAQQNGLTLDVKIDYPDLLARADEAKLREVIGNLVDNSLKYTKAGGVTIEVEKRNGMARVIVADTGVGIPPETISHLFQKFSRADAHKMNLLGTGLGLYLAKTFIEGMGGTIHAESDGQGKGSRFIIELHAV